MDESVTMDAGSDTAGETPSSVDTQSQDPGSTPPPTPAGKTYSEADLQRVLRGRIEQQNRAHAKQLNEYRQKQAEYEAVVQRMNSGIENMGRGFGFIKDEQPAPVTREDIQNLERQFDERFSARLEEVEQKRIYGQIQGHWKNVEQQYAEFAALPGFKEAWAKQWSPDKDPNVLAQNLVASYEKVFAARANAAAKAKDDRLKAAPVKAGGGTASVPGAGGEKVPLRKQMMAAIAASRE
jgi:hypothetical protein